MVMDAADLFEYDEPLAPHLTAFVAALRRHAVAWPADLAETYLRLPDPDDPAEMAAWRERGIDLVAWLDVVDVAANLVRATFGARLSGGRVHCDEMNGHNVEFLQRPTPVAFDAEGTAEELAQATAAWFEAQLRRWVGTR
ncbi:hypothetical protein AB0C02_15075 [Micromonospora sp. NPDC048999]|uniref:hypothetical protein n=1 Tax=Micromonospora sp. NPDC048999 TaxID=3155391 RepID=UPI003410BF32